MLYLLTFGVGVGPEVVVPVAGVYVAVVVPVVVRWAVRLVLASLDQLLAEGVLHVHAVISEFSPKPLVEVCRVRVANAAEDLRNIERRRSEGVG